jgi:hypothetical protein
MDKQLAKLEQILHQQMAAHDQLKSILTRRLTALRQADHEQIEKCCELENEQVQRIAELEKNRLELVADLTLKIDPTAPQPLRMNELAELLDEPARGRLLVLRQQLKERMEQIRTDMQTARSATDVLVRHMQGLMQTIGGLMTGVGTYGRRGSPPVEGMPVSTMCVTA